MNISTRIKRDVPLAPLTTFKIGGNARYFLQADSDEVVEAAFDLARSEGLDVLVLGGGSNVLIADAGFDGLVLQIASRGISINNENEGTVSVTAQAGEDWDGFVAWCVEKDLAGIECLSGIPGFVGGTPVQNVGAYGQEVAGTILEVGCYDREGSGFVTLSNAECGFSYRTSLFNSTARDRYVVLNVTFEFRRHAEPKIAYKELIEHFDGRQPTLGDIREAVLNIRRSKSMVIDENDPNSKSAGSFFKNPIVERGKLAEIQALFENVPYFEFGDKVKIPAAWLIDKAGFSKGFALGNAGISTRHNLAIINRGGASAGEIIALEEAIRSAVVAKFGIGLLPEPVHVGC